MLIIAGHARVAEADRDAYVTAHGDLVQRARKSAGCLDVAISADPLDGAREHLRALGFAGVSGDLASYR